VSIKSVVKNTGFAKASLSKASLYLSANNSKAVDGDTLIADKSIGSININRKRTVQFKWNVPEEIATGTYYLKVLWDSENTLEEIDEENNIGISKAFQIK